MADDAGSDDTLPASAPETGEVSVVAVIPSARRYRLGAELGRGGMGRVVEAFDLQLGRTVAFKEALPRGGASITRRFAREVQITARLEHASIVPLYDSGLTADGRPFYVMRRVTGKPLDEMIQRARGLGERLALLPAMLAAIDAVAHAHRRGVIHRDLKPSNILVGDLGETVVIDWGLAKVIGEADDPDDGDPVASDSLQTQHGAVFGTPGFMPPEQARGEELGTRSDVYALGATLYQLLAARPPHIGNSATELLSSTREHTVVPLLHECPGAPPELVAIVDKALAFEPTSRYPNAAALGEDVRRFLTGQLVAAHRYTRRQRVGRFTRKHRAPLAVAALAMVAVAVLAWAFVHRIVAERDAATLAREEAQRQERSAVEARDHVMERQDALILMHASAILDTNPTEAVAVLKQLAPTSPRLGDAVGLARAAVVRGVSWALQTTDTLTVSVALSPDSRRLAQATRDGTVRLWDLDRRRLMVAKHFGGIPSVAWVRGGAAVVIAVATRAPELFELATGATQPLPVAALVEMATDDAGDRLAGLDAAGNAYAIDMTSSAVTALLPGHAFRTIRIAADGHWIELDDASHIVVVDAAGVELTRHDGKIRGVAISHGNAITLIEGEDLYETTVAAGATWIKRAAPAGQVQDLFYRGDHLVALLRTLDLVEWGARGFHRIAHIDPVWFPVTEASAGLVVASAQGRIHVLDGLGSTTLAIPGDLPHLRLIARHDGSRLIAVGDGLILDYELDDCVPRSLTAAEAEFVDDDTILVWEQAQDEWHWYDIPSRQSRAFRYEPHGIVVITGIDPRSGRVLLKELAGADSRLVVLDKHGDKRTVVCVGADVEGRLLDGAGVLCSRGGKLLAATRDEPVHEVVTLDGAVGGMVQLAGSRYAAVSPSGEVIRGDLATGDVERIHLDPSISSFVGNDRRGNALIVADNRLVLWQQTPIEIARFGQSITQIAMVAGGVLVSLADHETLIVELRPGAPPHRILTASHELTARSSSDGTLIVGLGVGGQVAVIDLPSRSRWALPQRYDELGTASVSPNGRWILQHRAMQHYLLWSLPAPQGSDVGSWLDELTNAAEDQDGVLTWPWQLGGNATPP